jgi:hypothetical protein
MHGRAVKHEHGHRSLLTTRRRIGRNFSALWIPTLPVAAQTPDALPTAPGAERSVTAPAPPTSALASLRGDNGSPLEPYLFGFLFVDCGLIGVIAVKLADRRVRADWERPAFTTPSDRSGIWGIPGAF